ncbi:MAG: MBL fold metallo-hydrolase [Halioglobus sp.]|nr:MBL fold metallo-hydrolase [Halioglobus sp.]
MKKLLAIIGIVALAGIIIYTQRATLVARLMEGDWKPAWVLMSLPRWKTACTWLSAAPAARCPPHASGPCAAVVAGKQLFIVDAGTDGVRNLNRMGYQAGNIQGVFLTHFHSDHIDGLGEMSTLRWAAGDNAAPLPVYGPQGVERVVDGFNASYAQDFIYRHEHHGDMVAPMSAAGLEAMPFAEPPMGELVLVYAGNGLKVEALAVDHAPVDPAVGYLFSYKGRTLLITGDTTKQDNIRKFSAGIDLLVHEALAPNMLMMMHEAANKQGNKIMAKIFVDVLDYHTSPVEAAQTARDAGVGHLLYYHIVPPLVFPGQQGLWLNGAGEIFPDYTVGQDGVSFSLPANSEEIILTRKSL